MNIIKQHKRFFHISILISSLLLTLTLVSVRASASTLPILTPHILSSGSEQDLLKEKTYKFSSDGQQLIRLDIPQNGAISITLHAEKAGLIIAKLYTEAKTSDIPVYMQAQCTTDKGNTGKMSMYLNKGSYYLRFPENNYEAAVLLYPCKNQSLKNDSCIAAYSDYTHGNIYTYKAPSNGYISIDQQTLSDSNGSLTAVLCNAKGNALTEKAIFNDLQNNKITYAVKKGTTYKLNIKALNVNDTQYYCLKLKHTAVNEKSGSSKKKAVDVKFGNKASGIVLSEDSGSKADWYKIKNPKKQQLLLNYSGSITSGSLVVDVYDSKGKKLDSYSVISNIGEKKEALMHNTSGGTKMPAGTYYLRVTKSRKTSTGIYSFSLSGK